MADQHSNKTIINFDPTLFLFMGTTPGKVGWRLKKLITQTYGNIPILKFLWLDIDQNIDQKGRIWFNQSEERVELSGFDPAQIVRNMNNFPFIQNWWPDASPPAGKLTGGGGAPRQMRLVGRMAFFAKFNDNRAGPSLYTRLDSILNQLKEIALHRETEAIEHEKYQFKVNPNTVTVYMVFSPCGGTGSSMAFDLAYLCRHLLEGNQPRIISYSMAPSVFLQVIKPSAVSQRKKVQANAYAWLKEHNYLLENPSWNYAYSDGLEVDLVQPPFDYQYLVGIENQGGYRLSSLDDVASMMAQALFISSGTATAETIEGFLANVHRLAERFEGKYRSYSSFSAASLIFPRERLQKYCATRYATSEINKGFLDDVDSQVAMRSAATTLSRNGLLDTDLINKMMDVGSVKYSLAQSLRNAEDVSTAITIIDNQEAESQRIVKDKEEKIKSNFEKALKEKKELIVGELLNAIRHYGITGSLSIIQNLLDLNSASPGSPMIYSLNQVRDNIHQHGVSENDLKRERQEYDLSKKDVARLDDGPEDKLERMVNKKGWLKKFRSYKESVLKQLEDVNETQLQLSAQKFAYKLLDELTVFLDSLNVRLTTCKVEIEKRNTLLEDQLTPLLAPTKADFSIYEFLREVEINFDEYYQSFSKRISESNSFGFIAPSIRSIDDFEKWLETDYEVDLLSFAARLFEEDISNTSLLQILEQTAKQKNIDPKQYLKKQIDDITTYCLPFFKYNPNKGMENPASTYIIGVEDADNPILPLRDDDARFSIVTTGVKDRIDIVVFQFGLPAHMMDEMASCHRIYTSMISPDSSGNPPDDPLHILPEVDRFTEDFSPDKDEEKRDLFAIGLAFNYIIKNGPIYYVDPEKRYQEHKTTPPNEFKLDKGRENACNAFVTKANLYDVVEKGVQNEVRKLGNDNAIVFLDEYIESLYERIASYSSSSERTLRKVLENEIKAINKFKKSLII